MQFMFVMHKTNFISVYGRFFAKSFLTSFLYNEGHCQLPDSDARYIMETSRKVSFLVVPFLLFYINDISGNLLRSLVNIIASENSVYELATIDLNDGILVEEFSTGKKLVCYFQYLRNQASKLHRPWGDTKFPPVMTNGYTLKRFLPSNVYWDACSPKLKVALRYRIDGEIR